MARRDGIADWLAFCSRSRPEGPVGRSTGSNRPSSELLVSVLSDAKIRLSLPQNEQRKMPLSDARLDA